MTTSSPGDTKQEHPGEQSEARSDRADHGRTGEGAASALQYLISQDQHRKQNRDPAPRSGSSVHP